MAPAAMGLFSYTESMISRMRRCVVALLAAALVTGALPPQATAQAENAQSQARDAAVLSAAGAAAADDTAAKERASYPFDAGAESDTVVDGRGTKRPAVKLPSMPAPGATPTKVEPPPAVERKSEGWLPPKLQLGAGAVLGGLQGFFTAGLFGALAGAGMGLAAALLFHQKDYGASFGVTAGAIIGSALGGPIGGIIGAVVGGLIGHFLGKLFL